MAPWVLDELNVIFGWMHSKYFTPVITVVCNQVMIHDQFEGENIGNPLWINSHQEFPKHSFLIYWGATCIAEHGDGLLNHVYVCKLFFVDKLVESTLAVK